MTFFPHARFAAPFNARDHFADSPFLLEIPAFGGRRFSQKTADFRRKPKIFAGNRRLGSVTLGPSPLARPNRKLRSLVKDLCQECFLVVISEMSTVMQAWQAMMAMITAALLVSASFLDSCW